MIKVENIHHLDKKRLARKGWIMFGLVITIQTAVMVVCYFLNSY